MNIKKFKINLILLFLVFPLIAQKSQKSDSSWTEYGKAIPDLLYRKIFKPYDGSLASDAQDVFKTRDEYNQTAQSENATYATKCKAYLYNLYAKTCYQLPVEHPYIANVAWYSLLASLSYSSYRFLALSSLFFAGIVSAQDVQFNYKGTRIIINQGDITQQEVKAIVNAANSNLAHGGGVAHAINKATQNTLQNLSNNLNCPVGNALFTPLPNQRSQWTLNPNISAIINAVGPDCRIDQENKNRAKLLQSAYEKSLNLAAQNNIDSIAFPAISTEIFKYPLEEATSIALKTIKSFLDNLNQQGVIKEIRLIIYNNAATFSMYNKIAHNLF